MGPGRRRISAATSLLVLIVLTGAAPASADDTRLSADATAAEIAAFAGQLVWVRSEPDRRQRLVRHAAGLTADLPLRPSTDIAGVDLGSDRRGRPVAVYARCRRAQARDCDLFRYDLQGGSERKLRAGVSHGRCDEVIAAISRGSLLYARRSREGCRGGLFLKRPGRRAVRVGRRVPDKMDLAGSEAGLAYSSSDGSDTEIVLLRSGRRASVVAYGHDDGVKEATVVRSPAIDRGRLHWLAFDAEYSSSPDVPSASSYDLVRRRLGRGGRRQTLTRGLLVGPREIAVDRGQIFYTAATDEPSEAGVYRMDDPPPTFR